MVGLFPVTGLKSKSDSTENIEFRPISFRLVATVLFIFAVILLEGVGLLHMLLFRYENVKKIWTVYVCTTVFCQIRIVFTKFFSQREEPVYAHGNAIMNSNFAPVLHYGTTVWKKKMKSRFFFHFTIFSTFQFHF